MPQVWAVHHGGMVRDLRRLGVATGRRLAGVHHLHGTGGRPVGSAAWAGQAPTGRWYRLVLAPGTAHVVSLTSAPIGPQSGVIASAVSSSGKELAVAEKGPAKGEQRVIVFSVASARALRSWSTTGAVTLTAAVLKACRRERATSACSSAHSACRTASVRSGDQLLLTLLRNFRSTSARVIGWPANPSPDVNRTSIARTSADQLVPGNHGSLGMVGLIRQLPDEKHQTMVIELGTTVIGRCRAG